MAYERQGVFDDLNNALFEQMERLAGAGDPDDIQREVERSKAVSGLAGNVIANANTAISLMRAKDEGVDGVARQVQVPKMLGGGR